MVALILEIPICWTISLDPHGLIWGSLGLLWFISGSELQPERMTRSSLHVLRTKLRKPRASYDGLQGNSIMPDACVMIGRPREFLKLRNSALKRRA